MPQPKPLQLPVSAAEACHVIRKHNRTDKRLWDVNRAIVSHIRDAAVTERERQLIALSSVVILSEPGSFTDQAVMNLVAYISSHTPNGGSPRKE